MNRIREYRQARGWSLQRLADAAGTSKGQIDKLEKGARRLTVDWMVRLAKPLQCDPRDFMGDAAQEKFQSLHFGGGNTAKNQASGALIPVRGLVRGKNKSDFVLTPGAVDYVARPYYLAHAKDAYAFYVADDGMAPMYRRRQLLFVNPYKLPSAGGGVVILGKKGEVLIRVLIAMRPNGIAVRVYRPRMREMTIATKDIAAIHAVAGTVEP